MSDTNTAVIKKLDELDGRYVELEKQLCDPAVNMDSTKVIAISKEQGKIRAVVTKYREYKKLVDEIAQSQAILNDASADEEFKQLAAEDLKTLDEKKQTLFEQIKDSLVMSDDEAVGSVIVEIRAGTGGDEAALFARDLYDMYIHYAEKQRWKVELMDFSSNELGGFREVIFNVEGSGGWGSMGYEGGGHRVQRVPETETQGRIHTSAVTVAVLPEAEELDIQLTPDELRIDVFRSSGPGGQSVNTTDSAVRITHLPTGLVVSCQDEKSQHKNKAKALKVLRSRLLDLKQHEQHQQIAQERKTQVGSGDRSERIRTYNFPQSRITDHRIGFAFHGLKMEAALDGDLDELLQALATHYHSHALHTA